MPSMDVSFPEVCSAILPLDQEKGAAAFQLGLVLPHGTFRKTVHWHLESACGLRSWPRRKAGFQRLKDGSTFQSRPRETKGRIQCGRECWLTPFGMLYSHWQVLRAQAQRHVCPMRGTLPCRALGAALCQDSNMDPVMQRLTGGVTPPSHSPPCFLKTHASSMRIWGPGSPGWGPAGFVLKGSQGADAHWGLCSTPPLAITTLATAL